MLDLLLLVFFSILGLAGLIFKVEAGVFVGLSLAPWQINKLGLNKKLHMSVIILTSIIGIAFFLFIQRTWFLLIGFIIIQIYNILGYYSEKIKKKFIYKNKDENPH